MTASEAKYDWRMASFDVARADALARECGVSPLLAHLLLLRGVTTPSEARVFLNPSISHLSNPFELDGMRAAVDRIIEARQRDESILVFGDYDVDGIAATAILTRGLRRFGIGRVDCDMPDRFAEGYGLTPERVTQAKEEGHSLVITVDNGISAHEAARRAREIGMDLVVTDHHALDTTLPDAVAVINPKRGAPEHFAANLSGAGVALKLALALNGSPNDLDIAALGTVSDIVPLLAENRVIVALGLKHIKKHRRLGIEKLAHEAQFTLDEISAHKIGFQLGPRLNAAGRLDTGHTALELLMTDDARHAAALAASLDAANEERRAIERQMYDEAVEILEAFLTEQQRSIVLARADWHQGVIGILASRLQNKYCRPVIVFSMGDDGLWRGSARAGAGFNMMDALNACGDLLIRYGGHAAAAGMTLAPDKLEIFRECFEREALMQLGDGRLHPPLRIDALVSFSQLDGAFVKSLELLEPYGQGNPEPLFCSSGVEIIPQSTRILKDQHLKFAARQDNVQLSVIAFRMAERFYRESLPEKADLVFAPQLNTYNGITSVQLALKDLRVAENQWRGG
ncbi:MAG TPA: single-stranded-DNA-specific exonuclease RecJ [Candidatus Hydrogenedentes bacterium]|nr:single-stranded-DNA-specific exonuclease RecJ [Candidatus Hydrogenedentota bacterium]